VEVIYTDRKSSRTMEVVTLARNTENSGIDFGQDLYCLATEWGMAVTHVTKKGLEPYDMLDFAVVRLDLKGLSQARMEKLKATILSAPDGSGLGVASTEDGQSLRKELCKAVDNRWQGDKDHTYVNVACGTEKEMEEGQGISAWWEEQGFSVLSEGGPLLLTTVAGQKGRQPLMMPITPGSIAGELKALFDQTYRDLLDSEEPLDSEDISSLPTTPGGVPKWNSHSCRRGGARHARNLMLQSEAREEDINRHFGWLEEAMKGGKTRQVAYASTLPVGRRLAVTRLF
jgi:hypothetical protein